MPLTNVDSPSVVLRPPETLGVHNYPAFRRTVLEQLAPGGVHLVLDLAATGYVDAKGLGEIVSLAKAARDTGGSLALANLNEDLVALLELTRLDEVLSVVEPPDPCPECGDGGAVPVEHTDYVTREMAIDGGDPTLEGMPITSREWAPCPRCNAEGSHG